MKMKIILIILYIIVYLEWVWGSCFNNCNSHGICDKYSRCTCSEGYYGADCSLKECPLSYAWSDLAIGVDEAHKPAVCSNRGICDTTTGVCSCVPGFTGHACERLECYNNCNGVGICLTIEDKAKIQRDIDSNQYQYSNVWDAAKIMGCTCDPSHTGYNCGQKVCPYGDDPLSTGQVVERQLVLCLATSGTFTLFYKGYPSSTISHSANAAMVKKALQSIPLLRAGVSVSFTQPKGTACQTSANIILIEFTNEFGPQPPLVPVLDTAMINSGGTVEVSANGGNIFIDGVTDKQYVSIKGTKENDICSNRGICDYSNGYCTCYDTNGDAYGSSDGYGNPGTRGDCGHVLSTINNEVATCPGELQCSGHGVCDTNIYRCQCFDGWTSGDCSERTCPYGLSWYDYPASDQVAHTSYVECSNMGYCNRETGQCECREGFYGSSCENMACNGDPGTLPCTGHGKCISMKELATYSSVNGNIAGYTYGDDPNNPNTWDSTRIHGCLCDPLYEGFDCSLRSCPRGDDPGTYNDHSEVQLLRCIADGGDFTLTFRGFTTNPIPFNATQEFVVTALRSLESLSPTINVYFTHDFEISVNSTPRGTLDYILSKSVGDSNTFLSPVCNATDSTQVIIIDYRGVFGELPNITFDVRNLYLSSVNGPGIVTIFHDGMIANATDSANNGFQLISIQGSTENDVCNNRGLCNYETGICKCFPQWASSDGVGGPGSLGDCGHRIYNL